MKHDIGELKKKVEKLEKRIGVLEKALTPATLNDDTLLTEAKVLVKQYEFASASLLQRRLSIGYARAARILDQLEKLEVIGPGDGAKPRRVLYRRTSK